MKARIGFSDLFLSCMALKASNVIQTFGEAKIFTFTDEKTHTYGEYIISPENTLIAEISGEYETENE